MQPSHAFVIPAYGDSPFLAECVRSLQEQDDGPGTILIATSTPSHAIDAIATHAKVDVVVNPVRGGIAADWNFALQATTADFVTLAHQDDVYEPAYRRRVVEALQSHPAASIVFTNYREVTQRGLRRKNLTLKVKEYLCERAFRTRSVIDRPADKMRLLAWGNPVCCPSVTFNRRFASDFSFGAEFSINLDWDAWIRLGRAEGCFAYLPAPLVLRRIHESSETSAGLTDLRRQGEDLRLFRRLWPFPVSDAISFVYRLSYRTNAITG